MRADLPLTAEQVAELPEGALIEIIWSGGNGPHQYRVHIDWPDEQRYAVSLSDWPTPRTPAMLTYNPLDFVGQERYHTRVWLVAETPEPEASEG